jgi:hypothetical protein
MPKMKQIKNYLSLVPEFGIRIMNAAGVQFLFQVDDKIKIIFRKYNLQFANYFLPLCHKIPQ